MTTREKLLLMQDIKRKNDISWSKYAKNPRQYWTWEADVKKPLNPFESFALKCVCIACFPGLLVLFLLMA